MLSILLNLMGKVMLLVALGYLLRKYEIITARFQKDITGFMLKVALPANVLTTSNNPFSHELSHNLLLVTAAAVVYFASTLLLTRLIGRFLPLSQKGRTLFSLMVTFANTAFIGFPLAEELFGSEGLLYAVVFNIIWILLFYTVGISMFSGKNSVQLKSIVTVPVSVASVLAVLIYLSPFRFPGFVMDTLSSLGAMVAPISMLIIGCSLTQINLLDILRDRYSYLVSALRLVGIPAVILLILRLLPGFPSAVALAICLECCLPVASMSVVYSQEYDCEPAYASRAVMQSMLLMIFTVPLFMTFAISLFPAA